MLYVLVQESPSLLSIYPDVQVQRYDPTMLTQDAGLLHEWDPALHSSISENTNVMQYSYYLTLCHIRRQI